jgi:hypothetical protein
VPPGPGKEQASACVQARGEDGTWLTDIRVAVPNWKPGDRIPRGKDTLEVVRVRHDDERDVLVVRSVQV